MLKIYYTIFGEVYAGKEAHEPHIKGCKVIIVNSRWQEYSKLTRAEKTKEKIREYGWVVREDLIVKECSSDEVPEPSHVHENTSWNPKIKRRTMFIVGAGASANCVSAKDKRKFESDQYRPPLGNELFADRFSGIYKDYPGVRESLHYLQQDHADIESMLENDWKDIFESGNASVMKRHINIQYYLQDLLSFISKNTLAKYDIHNLYSTFGDKLKRIHSNTPLENKNCFSFISFNQDTILESFLSRYLLRDISSMDDYIRFNDNPFCLFKPHGSWNWGWQYPVATLQRMNEHTPIWLHSHHTSFYELYFQLLGNDIEMVDWRGWGYEASISKHRLGKYSIDKNKLVLHDSGTSIAHYPALLLPYRDKDEFTMPTSHFNAMKVFMNEIETLVIIGWKGNEAAFVRLLSQQSFKLKKIVVVDPVAEPVRQNLSEIYSKPNIQDFHYNDFESFVMTGMEKHVN